MRKACAFALVLLLGSITYAQTGASTTGGSQKPSAGVSSNPADASDQPMPSSGSTGSTGAMGTAGSMGQLSRGDRQFVEETAMANRAELELSRLAAQKASNPAVKQFAQHMVQDHSQASTQLMSVAQQKGVTLPNDVPEPDERLRDRLNQASGNEFDMLYMKHMLAAHTKDLTSFQLQSQTGQDPDVKRFAASKVPTLQEHRQQAESILSQMGVSVPASASSR